MEITQKIDSAYYRIFKRHRRIGRLLARLPWLVPPIRRVSAAISSCLEDYRRVTVERTADGYTAPYHDLRAAIGYAAQIDAPDFGPQQRAEGWALYQKQLETLRPLVRPDAPLFNFGICYAYVDAILARERPDCRFVGIDLSKQTAAFNRATFGDIPNLEFRAGDVFDALKPAAFEGGIFFHSRTLVLLDRDFIERLYAAVREAGFRTIVGFEQGGLSEEIRVPYTYSTDGRESVYWRDTMWLHNYPGIAENAGFSVKEMDLFTTGHASLDFQVLRFVADRRDS